MCNFLLQIHKFEVDMEHKIVNLTFVMYTLAFWTWNTLFQLSSQVQQWNCYQWSLQWRITTYGVFIFGRMSPNYNCYKRVQTSQAHLHDFFTTCTSFYTVLCSILTIYLHSLMLMCLKLKKIVCDTDFLLWIGIKICLWNKSLNLFELKILQ